MKKKRIRIRRLTERELFRLMGVSDADIDKIQAWPYKSLEEKNQVIGTLDAAEKRKALKGCISGTQQCKLAGNSIVVNVLEGIFTQMFRVDNDCLF